MVSSGSSTNGQAGTNEATKNGRAASSTTTRHPRPSPSVSAEDCVFPSFDTLLLGVLLSPSASLSVPPLCPSFSFFRPRLRFRNTRAAFALPSTTSDSALRSTLAEPQLPLDEGNGGVGVVEGYVPEGGGSASPVRSCASWLQGSCAFASCHTSFTLLFGISPQETPTDAKQETIGKHKKDHHPLSVNQPHPILADKPCRDNQRKQKAEFLAVKETKGRPPSCFRKHCPLVVLIRDHDAKTKEMGEEAARDQHKMGKQNVVGNSLHQMMLNAPFVPTLAKKERTRETRQNPSRKVLRMIQGSKQPRDGMDQNRLRSMRSSRVLWLSPFLLEPEVASCVGVGVGVCTDGWRSKKIFVKSD